MSYSRTQLSTRRPQTRLHIQVVSAAQLLTPHVQRSLHLTLTAQGMSSTSLRSALIGPKGNKGDKGDVGGSLWDAIQW